MKVEKIEKTSTMKKTNLLIIFVGLMLIGSTAFAQNFKYKAQASNDCTNATVTFTVPAGKTATIQSLEIVPVWIPCPNSTTTPNENWAQVKLQKGTPNGRNSGFILMYKKTVNQSGHIVESTSAASVVLNPGTYILEVCPSPSAQATLEIKIN